MKLKFVLPSLCAALLVASLCFVHNTHAEATPKRIEVTAKRFSFTPNEITLKKGEPVVLVLKSEDATHGLGIKDLGINIKAAKGQTTEYAFTPDKAGDFGGKCSSFCGSGHGSMKFTLHVTE
jgi:cytochrome c oxidase subunit II